MIAASASPGERVDICGVEIDSYDFEQVVARVIDHVQSGGAPSYVVTPNVHHLVLLGDDEGFREIYRKAFLVVPDGVPLLWAARLLGTPLRGRVNGTDLFERLCAEASGAGLSVFLLGGRPGAAEAAARVLRGRHAALKVAGTCCPAYGFESDPEELDRIERALRLAAPQMLFVGLGAPRQERWIDRYHQDLGIPISVGVGVSFEFVAGLVTRAPRWMQRCGVEWLHRLLSEPRRLWRRYVYGNALFVWMVVRQRLGWASRRRSRDGPAL